jgi:phasin family protein
MSGASDASALFDPSKLMETFPSMIGASNLAGIDPAALIKTSQTTIESLFNANQQVLKGYQALIQRQIELMQQMTEETSALLRSLGQPGTSPQDAVAVHTELARVSLDRSVSGMRELVDMATGSYRAAMDRIHDQVKSSLDDIRNSAKSGT